MRLSAKLTGSILLVAILCSAPAVAAPEAARSADSVRIYDPADLNLGRYEILRRLWVESWRSAFGVPRHASADAAVAELKTAAASLGADGLINVVCVPDQGWWLRKENVFCYALAIRLRK
ncbi:MAG: hypothetical protein AABZ67_11920 [Pseudomonadota bacterium]